MLASLALIIFLAFILYLAFERLKLPGILGFIAAGLIVGQSGLNLIHPKFIDLSGELKTFALIIILIRAGLSLNIREIKETKGRILTLSSFPLFLEILGLIFFLQYFFSFSPLMAAIAASILSPVAPAVIIPQMLALKEDLHFKNKHIPHLLLSATTLDNILGLTLFGLLIAFAKGESTFDFLTFLKIPQALVLGVLAGLLLGFLSVKFFKHFHIRDTKKVIIILFLCILLRELENYIPFTSYLAITSFGLFLLSRYEVLANRLSLKFSKIWILAELLLFVLIGAQLNFLSIVPSELPLALLLIVLGLLFRSLGTFISLYKDKLTLKEKFFSTSSFLPKATIQAALGSLPLSLGLPWGETILVLSVLSIIVTIFLSYVLVKMSK